MKYTVKVTGEAALGLDEQDFDLEASNGHEAVDGVRAHLATLLPKEGGLLDVVVSCLDTWTITSPTPRGGTVTETVPPGEVSSFSFRVEPHPDVREAVEAAAKATAIAAQQDAERAALKAELRAEIAAEAAAGKVVSK